MSSIIALFLFSAFVFFLLRVDHKQHPEPSFALWLPTVWLLLVTGKAMATWFGYAGSGMEEGSPLDRNLLLSLLAIGFFVIKKRNTDIKGIMRKNNSVILFLFFMLISVLWSEMPFISFKRWARNLVPIVMALIICSETYPRNALERVFKRICYIHIPFSLFLIKYFPHLGRKYGRWGGEVMWVGSTDQKNGLGFICLFTVLFFIWSYVCKWRKGSLRDSKLQIWLDFIILIIALYLFMGPEHSLTYSATAFAALIVALIALILFLWFKKQNIIINNNLLTLLIILVILFGTITFFLGRLPLLNLSGVLNRDESLTGRDAIWSFLLPYALKKPLLGHGFGGFWTGALRSTGHFPAHNGYLETVLSMGFVGLLFLSMFLIDNCRKACRAMNIDFEWGVLWFCLVLVAVTRNITESVIMELSGYMPGILLFMMISSTNIMTQIDKTKKKLS